MRANILKEGSYSFALRVVKLYRFLAAEQKGFVLPKQVLLSGTSIGADMEEAYQGESRHDFTHKPAIANKEAFETHYGQRLLRDSRILTSKQAESAPIKTAKSRK